MLRHQHTKKSNLKNASDKEAGRNKDLLDVQEEINLTLMQKGSETLDKINKALSRLDEGLYGVCQSCEKEIVLERLRALPFAVRCKDCEMIKENNDKEEERRLQTKTNALLTVEDLFNIS